MAGTTEHADGVAGPGEPPAPAHGGAGLGTAGGPAVGAPAVAPGPPGPGPTGWAGPGIDPAGPPGSGPPGSGPHGSWSPGSGPSGFDTAPRPGVIPLRPLGLGELFGGAVACVRRNPGSTVLPAAVVAVVAVAAQTLVVLATRRPTFRSSAAALRGLSFAGPATFSVGVLSLVLGAVLTALLIVVMRGAMIGRRTGLVEAWRVGRARVLGLVGLDVIRSILGIILVAGVIGGVAIGRAVARGAAGALIAVVIGIAAFAVVAHLMVLLSLAPAVYVVEGIGVGRAVRRSAGLVRGSWWRILGILLLAALVLGVVAVVLVVIVGAAAVLTSPATLTASPLALIVLGVAAVALYAVYWPFVTGLTTLVYADQRIRRERFDLRLATWAQAAPDT